MRVYSILDVAGNIIFLNSRFFVISGLVCSLLASAFISLRPIIFFSIVSGSINNNMMIELNNIVAPPVALILNEIIIVTLKFLSEILMGRSILKNADIFRKKFLDYSLETNCRPSPDGMYSVATQQIDLVRSSFVSGVTPLLSNTTIIFMLLYLNAGNSFIFLNLCFFIITLVFHSTIFTLFRSRSILRWLELEAHKSGILQAIAANVAWLRINSFGKVVTVAAKKRFDASSDIFFKTKIMEISSSSIIEIVISGAIFLYIFYSEPKGLGVEIVLLLGVLLTASSAIVGLGDSLNSIGDGVAAIKKINKSLVTRREKKIDGVTDIKITKERIDVDFISWTYGEIQFSLSSFLIEPRSVVWVRGASGSGKSVILQRLAEELRSRGVRCDYFNHSPVFVEEKVSDIGGGHNFEKYIDKAKIADLLDREIESCAGSPFSLGEAQRLNISKIISSELSVVILDEAMNGVPLAIQMEIISFLSECMGVAVVICSHDDLGVVADLVYEPRKSFANI